jgi:IS30 family transposase
LRRNAATRSGGLEYRATTAQWHAERAARRPKRAKLSTNAALRAYVQDRLSGRTSTSTQSRVALTAMRPKAEEPTKTVHAGISVAASPDCRHRQPHFIRRAHPIRDLQQQIEGEAELHLHDRQRQPLCRPDRDDVAVPPKPLPGSA